MIALIPWAAPFQATEWTWMDESMQIHYEGAKWQVVKPALFPPIATVKFLEYF